MLESIVSGIPGFVWSVAGVAFIALCGAIWKKVRGFHTEHADIKEQADDYKDHKKEFEELKAMQEVQNAALREVLGIILDAEHKRLVAQGYASPDEKSKFEKVYTIYHKLGGNGSRTALYEDVMAMHSYPMECLTQ